MTALRTHRTTYFAGVLAGLSLTLVPLASVAAVILEPSATLTRESVEIPAGQQITYAYALEQGTEFVFSLRTERWRRDPIRVWLIDGPNHERMSRGESFSPIDSGSGFVKRGTNFVVTVPRTEDYFVILDNTQARSPRTLEVYAYSKHAELSATERQTRNTYEEYYQQVRQLFEVDEFDEFDIIISRCGSENAYYLQSIVVCRELDDVLSDRGQPGARLFILLHEMAHKFLESWGYRRTFYRQNQADRFAATLIELIGRKELGAEAATWFESHTVAGDNSEGRAPFSMSNSRARIISAWLTETGEMDRGWTKRIVYPRMRTAALQSLLASEDLLAATRARIENELEERLTQGGNSER